MNKYLAEINREREHGIPDYVQDQEDIIAESKTPWEDSEEESKLTLCCGVEYDEDIGRCPECKENV